MTNPGTSAEEFILTARGGNVTRFFGFHSAIATPGRLKSITDRFGNGQSFAWSLTNGGMQVQSVTNACGRAIAYRYYGAEKGRQAHHPPGRAGRMGRSRHPPPTKQPHPFPENIVEHRPPVFSLRVIWICSISGLGKRDTASSSARRVD